MKLNLINIILTFIIITFVQNVAFAEKYLDVKKLYDLYAQEILDIDQLNSSLEKISLNNKNIKSLISLRKEGIISEDDFVDGVKKIIKNISISENKPIENKKNIIQTDINEYVFETPLDTIHASINSDFKIGEVWTHRFSLANDKITKISLKDQKNNDLMKFSKPRIKFLKNGQFTIRSTGSYLPEPSVSIRYDFKGIFEGNKVVGEFQITYTGTDAMGTVLLKGRSK